MSSPCKLQINSRGAWRDVLGFDSDAMRAEALQVAASNLVMIADHSGRTTLRIVLADGLQTVLQHWTYEKGWTKV